MREVMWQDEVDGLLKKGMRSRKGKALEHVERKMLIWKSSLLGRKWLLTIPIKTSD
jgi:hypothetical protein